MAQKHRFHREGDESQWEGGAFFTSVVGTPRLGLAYHLRIIHGVTDVVKPWLGSYLLQGRHTGDGRLIGEI